MIVFVRLEIGHLVLRQPGSPDGIGPGAVTGEILARVEPGGKRWGRSYEEWRSLGDGRHEVKQHR